MQSLLPSACTPLIPSAAAAFLSSSSFVLAAIPIPSNALASFSAASFAPAAVIAVGSTVDWVCHTGRAFFSACDCFFACSAASSAAVLSDVEVIEISSAAALARDVFLVLVGVVIGIEESWFLSRGIGTLFACAVSKSFLSPPPLTVSPERRPAAARAHTSARPHHQSVSATR